MNNQLQINEKDMGKFLVIEISGSIDTYSYGEFQKSLYSAIERNHTCLDMYGVKDLTSAGIGVLLSTLEISEETKHRLYILNPSASVKRVVESTGFGEMFSFIESIAEIKP